MPDCNEDFTNNRRGFRIGLLATIVEHQLSSRSVSDIQAVASAYNVAFWWSIGFIVIAIIPALLLSSVNMDQRQETHKVSGSVNPATDLGVVESTKWL
jgi:hypothetical protein